MPAAAAHLSPALPHAVLPRPALPQPWPSCSCLPPSPGGAGVLVIAGRIARQRQTSHGHKESSERAKERTRSCYRWRVSLAQMLCEAARRAAAGQRVSRARAAACGHHHNVRRTAEAATTAAARPHQQRGETAGGRRLAVRHMTRELFLPPPVRAPAASRPPLAGLTPQTWLSKHPPGQPQLL